MQRQQPKRASGVKALRAIKENSIVGRTKVKVHQGRDENTKPSVAGTKRLMSPHADDGHPLSKRNPLGNVTNCDQQNYSTLSNKPSVIPRQQKPSAAPAQQQSQETQCRRSQRLVEQRKPSSASSSPGEDKSGLDLSACSMDSEIKSSQTNDDTPMTEVQNFLQAASLCDSLMAEEDSTVSASPVAIAKLWKDIDEAVATDHLFSPEYAPEIYEYMRQREELCKVPQYLTWQPDISENMRAILIDWLIEVQENFEFFHETLYLGVKIVDRYLANKEVKKEYLQLVGATAMLIAAKFEELSPPLVDDFLYLCDDAYTHSELLKMETDILHVLDYDINVPISYRFIRRLARAADASMEVHTLARYISECTLQEYQFVSVKPSLIASSSMYLAMRMKKTGPWNATMQHYSGYTIQDMLPCVQQLNALIKTNPTTTRTVRNKYSHQVFFSVAETPTLDNVSADAEQALAEL